MAEWTVYLRSPGLTREGQIDDFQELEAIPRFNAVGAWSLSLDRRSPLAGQLAQPGWGIELVRDTTTVFGGPVINRARERSVDRNRITLTGRDDNVWLSRRLAHPQPSTSAPPYSTQAYDVRTGTCSTILRQYADVNAGPSALTVRQVTGLTLATDPVLGSSVTGRARWQTLLELLQELAVSGGNLGFRVRQSGTGLLFEVYAPTDRTVSVMFSEDLGNLAGYTSESAAPDADYVYCGGGGEGTARTVKEGQDSADIASWGRIEMFRDRRDTTDATELGQEITQALDENGGKTSLAITPLETGTLRYLSDYNLGDKVTAVIDGQPVQDIVRETHIKLTPDGPQQVLPTIDTASRQAVLAIFTRLRQAESRLTNLERR